MFGLFNLDAPVWVFMSEVADIIILALLWWICSLGIITVGASTTAVYYVLGKKIRKETTYVAKDFFKSFCQNFRQSVPLSILTIVGIMSLVLYATLVISSLLGSDTTQFKILLPVSLLFGFEFLNLNAYLWALLSRFDMKSGMLIKTAFIMLHKHLLTTILNVGFVVIVVYLVFCFPLAFIIAPSLVIGGQSLLMQKVFSRYIESAKENV